MTLTPAQFDALRLVVKKKLELWDASTAAEKLIGEEFGIEPDCDGLISLCASIDMPEDVDLVSNGHLAEAFGISLDSPPSASE